MAGVQIISSNKSMFLSCYDLLFCFACLSDASACERARTTRAATEKIESIPSVKTIWGLWEDNQGSDVVLDTFDIVD